MALSIMASKVGTVAAVGLAAGMQQRLLHRALPMVTARRVGRVGMRSMPARARALHATPRVWEKKSAESKEVSTEPKPSIPVLSLIHI